MRKIVYILFLFVAVPLSAQELSGGITIATQIPTVGEWYDIKNFGPYNVDKHAIGGVVNYVPEGRRFFYNSGVTLLSQGYDRFLQVPMTVNVFFGERFKGYLILGFYNAFRLNSSSNLYKGYDLGLIYGIGAEYKVVTHVRIFMEYNMYYGILSFERESTDSREYYASDYALLHFGFKYILYNRE
jgi:hypothetical protein